MPTPEGYKTLWVRWKKNSSFYIYVHKTTPREQTLIDCDFYLHCLYCICTVSLLYLHCVSAVFALCLCECRAVGTPAFLFPKDAGQCVKVKRGLFFLSVSKWDFKTKKFRFGVCLFVCLFVCFVLFVYFFDVNKATLPTTRIDLSCWLVSWRNVYFFSLSRILFYFFIHCCNF